MTVQNNIIQKEDKVLSKLKRWASKNDSVRTMILTGSRVNPHSYIDEYSDYDVELYVNDIEPYLEDNWLLFFDEILLRWPLKPVLVFKSRSITRLVLFESGIRIDFQITSQKNFNPHKGYDHGYNVLIDKDNAGRDIQKPTHSKFTINCPTKKEYQHLVNDFFWDATYVAKNLCRKELYYAKYMLDNVIRFNYVQPMIEWYIGMQNNWTVSTGKHGRFFKQYLSPEMWTVLEGTYTGAGINDNWEALNKMIVLFRIMARKVAENLQYQYPEEIDVKATDYCTELSQSNR